VAALNSQTAPAPVPAATETAPVGRVRFPLAAKLSLAVSALLVFSLGAIILAVWLFVRSDLSRTAAADNDSINYRVALAAETVLQRITVNTGLLLGNAPADAGRAFMPVSEKLIDFFFSQNPEIAAIVTLGTDKRAAYTYINGAFTLTNEIDNSLISAYIWLRGKELLRGGGETMLFNAAPDFYGLPILVIRFPYLDGNGSSAQAFVFFSAEELTDYFGTGASRSVLINDQADVLIHPDADMVPAGANLSEDPSVKMLPAGVNHSASRYHDDGGGFASIRRLAAGGSSAGSTGAAAAAVLTVIADDVVFEGITATTIRNIYFALFVWFLSLLLIRFFSRRLTRQLQILGAAAEAIEDGRYHNSIPVKTRDETGLLAKTMDSMRLGLLNFERFTNKEIARLTRKGLLTTGGSYKRATFFFSDIRSFTAISEKMEPAKVVEFLNDYMERMVACVMVTGGVIDKFIGDAVMAHWGAVRSNAPANRSTREPEDALAALRTALMMRAALQCFNRDRGDAERPVIKIGCGINSGKVVAGQIGTNERLEYTVIGDAVSLADHTETFNKSFGTEILISEHTCRLVHKHYVLAEMPEITEKGKKVCLFAVVNVKDPEETQRLFAELEAVPKIDMALARRFVGPEGPQTLKELRSRLGLTEPDWTKVKLDGREQKFKVQKS
jgi:adenylate cyclase